MKISFNSVSDETILYKVATSRKWENSLLNCLILVECKECNWTVFCVFPDTYPSLGCGFWLVLTLWCNQPRGREMVEGERFIRSFKSFLQQF